MAKQKSGCIRWFVEPGDDDTNGRIGLIIAERNASDVSFSSNIRCGDGQPHNLWECSKEFLSVLEKSRVSLGLNFQVFRRFKDGPILKWKFVDRKNLLTARQHRDAILKKIKRGSEIPPKSKTAP